MVTSQANTVEAYLGALPADRRAALEKVRKVIRKNLPRGIEEGMDFGMIGYFVPLSRHPETYNGKPLCFAALSSQKAYMSLYLMSVYGDAEVRSWFERAYRASGKKLDMGKSCVRFKAVDDLALDVIGEAIGKLGVDRFIAAYEASRTAAREKPSPRKATSAKKKVAKVPSRRTASKSSRTGR